MALNGLFCADVLRPLDLVPLTDFTYKCHPESYTMSQKKAGHFYFYNNFGKRGPIFTFFFSLPNA